MNNIEEIKKDAIINEGPAKADPRKESKPGNEQNVAPKMRKILIETDGAMVRLVEADVAGPIELTAVLQKLINFINKPQ